MSSDDVSRHYDASASTYHLQYARENLHTSEAYPANYFRLQILIRELVTSRLNSVYEVGVGEGTPLVTMARSGLQVAGCDISTKMVDAARANFEKNNLSPGLIHWGDIEDATTFAHQITKPFDSVVAAGVLPHVRDDRLTLRNIGMIVRPGGKVFIEFRNKLFSLFTFNRYTKDFILDDLLKGVSDPVKAAVEKEIGKRLALDQPPVRTLHPDGVGPGYDVILSKFHNPFELVETFEQCGYRNARIHWYHYHPAPPMLAKELGKDFRNAAMTLEHEASWRGYFLCSAGVLEAEKI